MKTLCATAFGLVAALLAAGAGHADVEIAKKGKAKLYLGVHTVGTVQALDHENAVPADDEEGTELGSLESGFQTAWGNIDVRGTFGDEEEIELFFDLYIASRPHASQTYGHEGYLLIRGVPENVKGLQGLNTVFDHIDLKVGHFEINFGDNPLRRSDNADVQNNPLIGNFLVDSENVEVGAEIYGEPGVFNWLVGVSSGTNTEDFQEGRGNALHGKVWLELPADLRLAGSYYTVDHSDNGPGRPIPGSKSNLFASNRSGGRYGGVFGGGGAPGQVLPTNGQDVSAWQADVTWNRGGRPLELYANYGNTSDDDTNGSLPESPAEEWSYYTAEAIYRFTENGYGAVRYTAAEADELMGLPSDGSVDRIQAGFGFWLTENLLGKVEYVTQKYRNFAVGDVVSGVQAWRNPEFDGVVAEVSFSF